MNRSRHGLPRSNVKKFKKDNLDPQPVEIEEELEDLDPFIRVNIGVYEFLFPKFHPDSNTN